MLPSLSTWYPPGIPAALNFTFSTSLLLITVMVRISPFCIFNSKSLVTSSVKVVSFFKFSKYTTFFVGAQDEKRRITKSDKIVTDRLGERICIGFRLVI